MKFRTQDLPKLGKQLKIYNFNVIDSTMTICEQWPKHYVSDKVSYVFIADSQKSGQGQRTNSWISPPGNCYVNYLFKMNTNVMMYSAQLAALSVVEVLATYVSEGAENSPCMKWVNDVFMGGQKVSGVLPKAENQGNKSFVWIGIGVNINLAPIEGSTCLKSELKSEVDLDIIEFIDKLSVKLFENIELLQTKDFVGIKEKISAKLEFLNKPVKIFDIKL
jgi:BirA family biotin operon repressor/biotin-[acetyl-CoA-carboxylase] ligase